MTNSRGPAGRRPRNARTTNKAASSIKLNSSLSDRRKARKASRAAAKAEYLATLPKDRWKRLLYRLHPKRVAAYWFSREGAIMALKIVGVGVVACFFLTIGLFAYFRKDLPKIKDISGDKLGGSITYYDRTGQVVLWQDYDAVKRIPVTDDNISNYMKEATVAVEDKDFYKHGAFDVRGIMRAAAHDVTGSGGAVQGGSTITQQLVKLNENWTDNRTVTRKVKELILAVELEREYSKKDILTGYLNIAPYGGVEYGVESAANDYFQTSAKNLTLPQAAMLAAIPQSPSYYSPYGSTKFNSSASGTFSETALLNRQHYILDQMAKQGYITQAQADDAKKVDILAEVHPAASKYNNIKAPYFVLAAKNQLQQKYGASTVQRGGWKVITTLNMSLQDSAESLVAKNLPNVKRYGGDEEAMAAEDVKTGQMVALVGGTDFTDADHGQINYAQINISPGSSFKPYDYTTLIENNTNVGAGSVLYDTQGPLPGYPCSDKTRPSVTNPADPDGSQKCLWDYDFAYPGAENLRYALAGSRNVPAVKAMLSAVPNDTSNGHLKSVDKVISTANTMMGDDDAYKCYQSNVDVESATKSDEAQCYGASAIGDGAYLHLDEHVNGLSTIARLGEAIPQTYILKITDSSNKAIYQWTQPKGKQVVRQDSAFIVDSMLSDPKASYLNSAEKFQSWNGWNIAVKTGTTNDNYDGLMTAWTTQYAVASWVGYHTRNKAMTAGHMETMTEPLTRNWMEDALGKLNTKPVNWTKPSDVKVLPAYVQRSHVGLGSQEPSADTDYFPSWYVPKSGTTATQTIDKVSNLLATSCTPADAKQTVGGANDNSFSADIFWPVGQKSSSSTTTTTASDNVHNCSDTMPSVTLTAPSTCSSTDNGNQGCTITATVTAGTHPLGGSSFGGTVAIDVNGNVVKTFNVTDSPSTVSFFYSPTSSGSATITATVTDSVLYQATDSASVTLNGGTNANQTRARKPTGTRSLVTAMAV